MKDLVVGLFAVAATSLPAAAGAAVPQSATAPDAADAASAPGIVEAFDLVIRSHHPAIDRLLLSAVSDPSDGHDKSTFDKEYDKLYDRTTYSKSYDKTS